MADSTQSTRQASLSRGPSSLPLLLNSVYTDTPFHSEMDVLRRDVASRKQHVSEAHPEMASGAHAQQDPV